MKTNILLLVALLGTSIVYAQQKKTYHTEQSRTNDDNTSITTDFKGARYQIEMVNDKMTELSVDGKKIPAAEWGNYDAAIKEIMVQVKKDRIQAEKDREQAERDRAQADLDREQAMKDKARAEKDRERANQDRAQADLDREQAMKDKAQAEKDREQANQDRAQAELDRQQAVKDRARAEKDREQAAKDRIQAEKDRVQAAEDRKQMQAMISEMVSDKIIPNESGLHDLRITDDEMLVNGKKQDDEVFKKYKAKYSRFSGSNVIFNRNGSRIYMSN